MDAQYWDDRYGTRDQLFSGNPNGVLVTEVADLPPGRALDVGCGEGGDARWLALRGWHVTGIDISELALQRAAAAEGGDRVTWRQGDLRSAPPEAGAFDLVSAQYFPLLREPGHAALRGLLAAVAPGGTLLVANHNLADFIEHHEHHERDFDPADFYETAEIADLLDDGWTILVNETRPRTAPAPEGTGHVRDTVLRALRRQSTPSSTRP